MAYGVFYKVYFYIIIKHHSIMLRIALFKLFCIFYLIIDENKNKLFMYMMFDEEFTSINHIKKPYSETKIRTSENSDMFIEKTQVSQNFTYELYR